MIDHVLGRPSVALRKYQVGIAVGFWSAYLLKGNTHGPPGLRALSSFASRRLTPWQTIVVTFLTLYIARNFGKIVGLESPEPLANLYTRSYFRATYVMTALDAGFWSAMRIKRKWARDILSIIFSIYYLICAEQADEKVRKIRAVLTVEHLRVSWNKSLSPYLAFFTRLTRPRFTKYPPRAIRIPRPADSAYTEPIHGWLYFDGPVSALKKHTKIVLNIPGGGFVAMSPRTHDDSLLAWAGKTGYPVLSLDYRKAPEYPYPYALNECFDVYRTLVASQGRCIGLSGDAMPQIVLSGDSAGGNLAAGTLLMILQSGTTGTRRWLGQQALPHPVGLILIYPALDFNIGNWMTDEQMALIRDRQTRHTNKRIIRHKSMDFRKLAATPGQSSDDDSDSPSSPSKKAARNGKAMTGNATSTDVSRKPTDNNSGEPNAPLKTRLAVPSLMSYTTDRILTPEMMRAMIILYIGPHNRPDFATEFLLSPLLAPDSLLAAFPKTYFLTGERDPLVDDTLIMAGRIRAAKKSAWMAQRDMGVLGSRDERRGFNDRDHVNVVLVEGISHGFIQFGSVYHEAWGYIYQVGKWFEDCFATADRAAARLAHELEVRAREDRTHRHRRNDSSGDEDHGLEMMRLTRIRSAQQGPSKDRPDKLDLPAPTATTAEASEFVYDETRPTTPYTPGPETSFGMARDHPLGRRGSSVEGKSFVSLASSDDLLGRRMKGLAGGLTKANPDL